MEASSSHTVMVQKVNFLSINSFPFIRPFETFNSFTEASFALMNGNRKNKDFTRSLVTEINGMQLFYTGKISRLTHNMQTIISDSVIRFPTNFFSGIILILGVMIIVLL
jgi:hypothetical protein